MGACTWTPFVEPFTPVDGNTGYAIYGTITMSNSYAVTTGDSLTGSQMGVGQVNFLDIAEAVSPGPNPSTGLYTGVAVYNSNQQLTGVRVYVGTTGLEVANATNLSNLQFVACAQKTT